jgi:hypothetical protein
MVWITSGSPSGANTFSFTSIPSTFTHLQIRAFLNNTGGNISISMQFNSSGGTNYARHILYGDGASALSIGVASTSSSTFTQYSGSTASIFHASIIDILDYTNTNKYKTVRSINGVDNNGSGLVALGSAVWMVTDAISSITFTTAGSTWAAGSRFDLYGITSSQVTGA